jgi:predicted nucleic-acid-binding protein
VKITADTNVLVRALVRDDPDQARQAMEVLEKAELVAIPVPVLCELVWVLRRVYGLDRGDCLEAITALLASRSVVVDRPAVEAGLRLLAAGGDFADGVIALEGRALGAQALITFDREAARLLQQGNEPVVLLEQR